MKFASPYLALNYKGCMELAHPRVNLTALYYQ